MSQGTFAELGLPSELVDVLSRNLIKEPFEIQALAIPDALEGRDILGRAPTGSGKTLAFGLPMLARMEMGSKKHPRALILSPTRELAEQIRRELEPLAKAVDRSVIAVYGGTGLDKQIKALRNGVDVLVACPGRLLDLINQRAVYLEEVDIVVVDEADRMADMGFLPDVKKLLDQTSKTRQTVLFSATLDREVQVLTDKYQKDPVTHEVGEAEPDLSTMQHRFIKVKKTDRVWLSADVIAETGPTVVFCRTRHGVDRVARQLKNEGVKAGNIHGGRSQSQRDRALKLFIDGKVDALVATDVAARGIHVDGVACVIHFDPPAEIKDYVHRSGRTARAGAAGVVVSFLEGQQVKESEKMRRKLGLDAEIEATPGRMPRSSRPEIVEDRRASGSSSKSGSSTSKPSSKSRKPSSGGPKRRSDSADSRSDSRDDRPRDRNRSGGSARQESRPGGKPGSKRTSSSRGSSAGASSSRGSSASGSSARSGSSSRDESSRDERRPAAAKRGGTKSSSPRSSSPRSSGPRSSGPRSSSSRPSGSKASSARDSSSRSSAKPSDRKPRSASTKPGRPTDKGSASAGGPGKRKKTNAKGSTAGKATAKSEKPKRSGKPRPKNRKNKPKTTGRR